MMKPPSTLFPYPHFLDGKMIEGSVISVPEICNKCKILDCFKNKSPKNKLNLCSFGYNYMYVNNQITIFGIILNDYEYSTKNRNRRLKTEHNNIVKKNRFSKAYNILKSKYKEIDQEIEDKKDIALEKYINEEQYKVEFLDSVKEEIQKGLSFVHDYKQINTQISQNINVIIETKYKGESIDDKLKFSTREEKAIYEASKLLDEKLNVAKFLMHPEWLYHREECTSFRFHGLVNKYYQIYHSRFKLKNINVKMLGESHFNVYANSKAVSIIPQTLIDNASKYSPKNGKIEVYVNDDISNDYIMFEVSSYGPRITKNEENKIFQPFFRGNAAIKAEEEGAGYGLYISQMIAKRHLGTEIKVEQDPKQTQGKGHWTTFSINIPKQAAIL